MQSLHPRSRIPPLLGLHPPISTDKGPMPAERALAYNHPGLLLHGPAATRPGHHFSAAELAGYSKTSLRLFALLRPFPWIQLQPLEWLSPEALVFHCSSAACGSAACGSAACGFAACGSDGLVYDLIHLEDRLEQAERLLLDTLHTEQGAGAPGGQAPGGHAPFLIFYRC